MTARAMHASVDDPLYYLANFQRVLEWIGERYADLLDARERAFLARFPALPQASRALLVRMVMRKGTLFRLSRLQYAEIGNSEEAARALLAEGWVLLDSPLSLDELFALARKDELVAAFAGQLPNAARLRKDALRAALDDRVTVPALGEPVYRLALDELCERLRLMFFGNLRQDWSEFVLADLGYYRYEQVAFDTAARGFQQRADMDAYLALQRCREGLDAGLAVSELLAAADAVDCANPWLEGRRQRLLFRLGQQLERDADWGAAAALYARCQEPGARGRQIRVLERGGRHAEALQLAEQAALAPQSESERQQLERVLPRLRRHFGAKIPRARRAADVPRLELCLPRAASVELAVGEHLWREDAPVFYVENGLLGSLFGLLCWEAIFAALPGAFFHPYQAAPADLRAADFRQRREALFEACLAALESDYRERIRRTYLAKQGLQNPFVHWALLDEALLELALECLPAAHLRRYFERLLADPAVNRSGLPDLIQFHPAQRDYRMIEVKGPGDRLQDNQLRWLDYCLQHELPVAVCYVRWREEALT